MKVVIPLLRAVLTSLIVLLALTHVAADNRHPERSITVVIDILDTPQTQLESHATGTQVRPVHCWVLFNYTAVDYPMRVEVVAPILNGVHSGLALAVTEYSTTAIDLGAMGMPGLPANVVRRSKVLDKNTTLTNEEIFDPRHYRPGAQVVSPPSFVERIWLDNEIAAADREPTDPAQPGNFGNALEFLLYFLEDFAPFFDTELDDAMEDAGSDDVSSDADDSGPADIFSTTASDAGADPDAAVPQTQPQPQPQPEADPLPLTAPQAFDEGSEWVDTVLFTTRPALPYTTRVIRYLFYEAPMPPPSGRGVQPRAWRAMYEMISTAGPAPQTRPFEYDIQEVLVGMVNTRTVQPELSRDPLLTNGVLPLNQFGSLDSFVCEIYDRRFPRPVQGSSDEDTKSGGACQRSRDSSVDATMR